MTNVINIRDIFEVQNIIEQKNIKIFGIGGTPITRTEAHHITENIEIICAVEALSEIAQISKKVKIKCFPLKNTDGTYVKKPSTILSDKKVQDYINAAKENYNDVAIFIMKSDVILEQICRDNDWILIGNTADIIEKYNSKELFQKILHKMDLANDAVIMKLDELHKYIDSIFDRFGQKIVIQLPEVSGGGHGTFFFDEKDKNVIIEKINQRIQIINEEIPESTNIIVNSFFEGPTLSILGTVTRDNGIIVSNPQHQLIDIAEVTKSKNDASGIFCGHDWTLSIPQDIKDKAINISQKIGEYLQENSVLGIFGTDLMWDINRNIVVPIEINTRLTGVFPSFVDVQILNNEVPILAFHLMDFLKISYSITDSRVYRKESFVYGAHMIIFNNYPYRIRVTKIDIRSGVYSLQNNKLCFERDGFEMSDIQKDNEFIITDGVPEVGSIYSKNRKLLKVISKSSLGKSSYDVNSWGREIITSIYSAIKCEKYE